MLHKQRQGFRFFLNNSQFVYGILLLVLVPAALVVNTVVFIKNTDQVIDIELQRKASLANSLFGAHVPELLGDEVALQSAIRETVKNNEEIYSLDVLVPSKEDFKIVASLDKEAIGSISKYVYNTLAWRTEEAIAYSTRSRALSTEDQSQLSDERFWVVVKPVLNDTGEKVALVSMKISSRVIDELARENVNRSVLILIASLVVIILLLVNNIRLFQYALLFRKLQEVDEMKDEFISMASHELRAPITGIRGYLQMTIDGSFGKLPAEAEQKLRMVMKQSENLNNLVGDLLDVSRIEQGRMQLNPQKVVTSAAIGNVARSFEAQAVMKGISLKMDIPADYPAVYADESKLRQVLVNLVSNAIKYTKQGSVTIIADIHRGVDHQPMARIRVKDTGMGMSAQDRERLFDKFYR